MARETVRIEGLRGVLETLKQLPAELVSKRGGPVAGAIREALKPMQEEAKANIRGIVAEPNEGDLPTDSTGLLEQNIVIARASKMEKNGETFRLRIRKKVYPRDSSKPKAKGRRDKRATTPQVGRLLEYGTEKMRAKPWLRPAFEAHRRSSLDIFAREMNTRLQRIVKKLERQNGANT